MEKEKSGVGVRFDEFFGCLPMVEKLISRAPLSTKWKDELRDDFWGWFYERRLPSYDEEKSSIKTYIYSSLKYRILNFVEKQEEESVLFSASASDYLFDYGDKGRVEDEEFFDHDKVREIIASYLSNKKEIYRVVLEGILKGTPRKEMRDTLGCSLQYIYTVRSKIFSDLKGRLKCFQPYI